MTSELAIRRYEPRDADAVWTVHEAALRASALEFVEDAAADEDVENVEAAYLDDGEFLVGVRDGDVVAVGGFRPVETDAVEVRRMRVHPDHQREGHGERMLAELEARARDRGFDRVVLYTHERLRAARRLYESHGYEETRRERPPDAEYERIHYEKSL